MPRNLEIKVRVDSLAPYRRRLGALPAYRRLAVLRQSDHYFRTPRGYLKLRVVKGGLSELIYYVRPRRRGARQSVFSRWRVEDPPSALRLLTAALGIDAVVRKTREVLVRDGARIHLDRVAGLGLFVEVEVMVEHGIRQASRLMERTLDDLQLPPASTPGSYRDLLRRRR